jgi:predicted tellurium resistance membrane protein TerC
MTDLLELFSQPSTWVSLATLAALEIVLGIDNIVFISILTSKLPAEKQDSARRMGLILALGMRLALLFGIKWLMGLTSELFSVMGKGFTGKDLILLVGGLFLVGKASHEIFDKLEASHDDDPRMKRGRATFGAVLTQIVLLDVVFSLDSVITAVGMVPHIEIMVAAVIISIGVMLLAAKTIGDFVNRHPSIKILALSFLLLIGVLLIADGFGQHISKGYVYFAMAFSLLVELVNMRMRKVQAVKLKDRFENDPEESTPPVAGT